MVNDILCIQNCNDKSVAMNATVNAFIESKKLTLSASKCQRIHVEKHSKNKKDCQKLKVHEIIMEDKIKAKYLILIIAGASSDESTDKFL